jgi:hypothetical protein
MANAQGLDLCGLRQPEERNTRQDEAPPLSVEKRKSGHTEMDGRVQSGLQPHTPDAQHAQDQGAAARTHRRRLIATPGSVGRLVNFHGERLELPGPGRRRAGLGLPLAPLLLIALTDLRRDEQGGRRRGCRVGLAARKPSQTNTLPRIVCHLATCSSFPSLESWSGAAGETFFWLFAVHWYGSLELLAWPVLPLGARSSGTTNLAPGVAVSPALRRCGSCSEARLPPPPNSPSSNPHLTRITSGSRPPLLTYASKSRPTSCDAVMSYPSAVSPVQGGRGAARVAVKGPIRPGMQAVAMWWKP